MAFKKKGIYGPFSYRFSNIFVHKKIGATTVISKLASMSVNHIMKRCIAEFHALRHKTSTTYNVLLRYLAYVSRCYILLPIMLKIFYILCQLADDFYEKSIFFHILVGFYPSKSARAFSLLLLTIYKWQFSNSGQILFNRADKNKSTVSVLCLIFFGHALLYE